MEKRARIILLAGQGLPNPAIAEQVGVHHVQVCQWRQRFVKERLQGLYDKPRSGRPLVYGHDERLHLVDTAVNPPKVESHWSTRTLAGAVGMSKSHVQRLLKRMDVKPHRVQEWLSSRDPEFEVKQLEIVGLYLSPPENALVIAVDERTQMVVHEPVNPSKPMRPGTPERREFEYVRHGTQSLLAALLVHQGKVIGRVEPTHTRVEFIRFLEVIDSETPPEKDLHLILDNLQVHKTPEVKAWLAEHPRFHLHFTPTHASWLNQIEIWFSILGRRLLSRGIFTSKEDQAQKIMDYIEHYNQTARPFAWISQGKVLTA